MLKKLEVLNGEMSLKFDPLNDIYTIKVNSDVTELVLSYEAEEGYSVEVEGNTLEYGLNEVLLNVGSDNKQYIYKLYVTRSEEKSVNANVNQTDSLQIEEKTEVWTYAAPVISSVCFIIILLLFTLLFKKNKNNRFM